MYSTKAAAPFGPPSERVTPPVTPMLNWLGCKFCFKLGVECDNSKCFLWDFFRRRTVNNAVEYEFQHKHAIPSQITFSQQPLSPQSGRVVLPWQRSTHQSILVYWAWFRASSNNMNYVSIRCYWKTSLGQLLQGTVNNHHSLTTTPNWYPYYIAQ